MRPEQKNESAAGTQDRHAKLTSRQIDWGSNKKAEQFHAHSTTCQTRTLIVKTTAILFQEIVRQDTRLFQNCPESALRHLSGMIWNGSIKAGLFIIPDLMTAHGLTIKGKTELFQPFDDLPVAETGQPPHLCTHNKRAVKRSCVYLLGRNDPAAALPEPPAVFWQHHALSPLLPILSAPGQSNPEHHPMLPGTLLPEAVQYAR